MRKPNDGHGSVDSFSAYGRLARNTNEGVR